MRHLIAMTMFALCLHAEAQQMVLSVSGNRKSASTAVAVDDIDLKPGPYAPATLDMNFSVLGAAVGRRRIVTITPRLTAQTDSADFPSVELYGKWAHMSLARSGVADTTEDMHLRATDARQPVRYAKSIPYRAWMRFAKLKFVVTEQNGCRDILCSNERWARLGDDDGPVQVVQAVVPTSPSTAAAPAARPGHIRHFNGTAYIDYPVNRTEIFPEYHDNHERLAAIRTTLDSVLHGDHSLIKHITLRGFASPEGSYANNERLARGRVNSLRRYIIDNFDVPAILISADYEPEDWEGLRRHVAASKMPERKALLDIIDSSEHPDEKLSRIAINYPETYQRLLREFFPYLRHTDYRIDYISQEQDGDEDEALADEAEQEESVERVTAVQAFGTASAPATASTWQAPPAAPDRAQTYSNFATYRPLFALKTNLLLDAALAPNVELEIPMGRRKRWSMMAEVWCPWWRFSHNPTGEQHRYYRTDQRPTRTAYEVLAVGAELRWWMAPGCAGARPVLSGAFLGLYGAGGKYDLGRNGKGDQGEFTSIGLSLGYSWPIARHWNLELSAAAGYVGGPKVHYQNEFDDTHLIYRHNEDWHYFGPTKLKLSLAWLIGAKSRKGGGQ